MWEDGQRLVSTPTRARRIASKNVDGKIERKADRETKTYIKHSQDDGCGIHPFAVDSEMPSCSAMQQLTSNAVSIVVTPIR